MKRKKYSELRRIGHSLNNFKLSITNNLYKLGFSGDIKNSEEVFNFLHDRVFNANMCKKPVINDDLKEKIRTLLENMWINESFVQTSLKNVVTTKTIDPHYFYLVYVSFYYSLFTSISIVLRLFDNNILQDSHQKKIYGFNHKIVFNKFLQGCYFKPFTLVIFNNEIKNLDVEFSKSVDIKTLRQIDKIISNYNDYCKQKTVYGKSIINEDIYTLKISKSLLKYYIENGLKSNCVSYIQYFMSKRHFLHYNASFIYNVQERYELDKLLEQIKINMIFILNITNTLTELVFIRIAGSNDFKNIFRDFGACLLNCIDDSFTEDDFYHQFENVNFRAKCHQVF
ncbi:hypothetical protein [Methanobacterium formicicum]|nr:hypothetical protein [Methanobacterium formicicum]